MGGIRTVPSGWLPATNTEALSEYYVQGGGYNWQTNICDINVPTAEDYYLVFFWSNQLIDMHNPPAAVDNINVTYAFAVMFGISDIVVYTSFKSKSGFLFLMIICFQIFIIYILLKNLMD